MAATTTLKPIALSYRTVGSSSSYTRLMGVLKGLSISQDEPDSTEIEAEFYDSPFDIFYQGKPVTMTFELANYELSELEPIFGGDAGTGGYEGPTAVTTNEFEWKLDFGRGYASLVIYKGLTIGTLKKDADGALNFAVTITSSIVTTGTGAEAVDHMYKIVASAS